MQKENEELEEKDKSLLREKDILKSGRNEAILLKKWLSDYIKTDFPGRYPTRQYYRHLERHQELTLASLSKNPDEQPPQMEEQPIPTLLLQVNINKKSTKKPDLTEKLETA